MFTTLESVALGWAKQPFKEDMNAWQWVLFLGFVIVIVFLWTRVMRHIVD